MKRIAINGFGRIGRAALKIAMERDDAEMVAINDLADLENLGYLLRHDSNYGRYDKDVEVKDGELIVDGVSIKAFSEPDPEKLPWEDLSVDTVIESTGFFTKKEDAEKHLTAGAGRVVISAPTKSEELVTAVIGVNDYESKGEKIISNASCSTNCAAPVAAIMDNAFGVNQAILTTIHAYTSTQSLVDGPHKKDWRRGRSAATNIVPTTTGAAIAATKAYEPLAGKFDGVAVRVPVPVVSLADFVFVLKEEASEDEIKKTFQDAVKNSLYEGVVDVAEDPVVSSDFIGDPHSAIVDLSMVKVVDGTLVKIMAWYDNEWAYSNRLVEAALRDA